MKYSAEHYEAVAHSAMEYAAEADTVADARLHLMEAQVEATLALAAATEAAHDNGTGRICGHRSGVARDRECLLAPGHDGWHEGLGSSWSRGSLS